MSPGAAAAAPPARAPPHPARRGPERAVKAVAGRGGESGRARGWGGPTPAAWAALTPRGRRPWRPPARAPRGPSAGVWARAAGPWAEGAGGRSSARTVSPAGATAARRARGGRRSPRLHCLWRRARSHLRAFFAQLGDSAVSPLRGRAVRAAAPAAAEGRAGGGLKWKCAPGRGGGRRAATAGRAPSPAADPGSAAAGARPGGWPKCRGGSCSADRSLRGRPGVQSNPKPTPALPGSACESNKTRHMPHQLRVYVKHLLTELWKRSDSNNFLYKTRYLRSMFPVCGERLLTKDQCGLPGITGKRQLEAGGKICLFTPSLSTSFLVSFYTCKLRSKKTVPKP